MIHALSSFEIISSFLLGSILSGLYLGLLWFSIRLMTKVQHKVLFLFLSTVLRLVVFICAALYFSQHNAGRFLCIVSGFLITRLVVVAFVKSTKRRLHD